MAMRYNSPPGWPTPPQGWTPPPGWQPDPAWGPAPEGWQFWVDDGTGPEEGEAATESFPAQAGGAGATAAYQYDPSGQLEPPAESPYDTGFLRAGHSEGQAQGVPPGQHPQGGYPAPGGYAQQPPPPGGGGYGAYPPGGGYPGPGMGQGQRKPANKGILAAIAVLGLAVIALLVWGGIAVFGGDDEPTPTVEPTEEETQDPTDEPTEDPTEDPTDEPTEDPTDDPDSDDNGGSGDITVLSVGDSAVIDGTETNPGATLTVLDVESDWQASSDDFLCDTAELGQYIAVEVEVETFDVVEPFSFSSMNLTTADADGNENEDVNPFLGLLCEGADPPPPEMDADTAYSGTFIFDTPEDTAAIRWQEMFDFTGSAPAYIWEY